MKSRRANLRVSEEQLAEEWENLLEEIETLIDNGFETWVHTGRLTRELVEKIESKTFELDILTTGLSGVEREYAYEVTTLLKKHIDDLTESPAPGSPGAPR